MRSGHPLGAADRIALDQAVDDLNSAAERTSVHKGFPSTSVCSIVDTFLAVNRTAYLDFRKATDILCDTISHDTLANALGVSVATVRQARLRSDAKAHRGPPREWRETIIRLAEERVWHYRKLIEEIRRDRREAIL